jgi:lysophospholipase L1-like esterase
MRDRQKPSRSVRLALVASLGGLAVALLLVEGLVRLAFDEAVQPRYVIDPGYGVRANQPNVRTRHYVPGDYDVAISTNSAGMRGRREYPVERVPGKRRILVLGDSFTFGYGVNDDEVVSAVLEDLLNERASASAEVLNLAVSGFGQAEELVTWENRGKAYRPDVVVLFYFENDIGNNAVSRLYQPGPDGLPVRTGADFLPGSSLQERLFAFPPTRWLFEHSEAWNLVRNRLSSLVQRSLLRQQGLESYSDGSSDAVELTRALLRGLVADIRAAGARPVLFVIPDSRRLDSNLPLTERELTALGVTVVDGRGFLTRDDYYARDSHWRPSGHRKAAEQLAAVIDAQP